jgi:hypothetical protein
MTEVEAILAALTFLKWIFGAIGATAFALFGIWWKVESGQNNAIRELNESNIKAHDLLHKRISSTKEELKDEMTRQHLQIRDRIDQIKDLMNEKCD